MKTCISIMFFAALATSASADVVAAGPDHYELRHEASSSLPPAEMWDRLVQPEIWWHPDHTYSGDAANLSLNATAGGLWREDWEGGSVSHGEVLMVREGEQLRLDAPFGPLQEMGVQVTWTITLDPDGDGTRVTFHEVASGSSATSLDQIAPAVDNVKAQAIARLTAEPVMPDTQTD